MTDDKHTSPSHHSSSNGGHQHRPPHLQRGGWLPAQDELEAWLDGHRSRAHEREDRSLRPSVQALAGLIATDPVVRMQFTLMLEQEPRTRNYAGQHISSVDELLLLIDEVTRTAPAFAEHGMVSTPFAAVLDRTMGTPAGEAAYRNPRVNEALHGILAEWEEFLNSEDSLGTLHDGPGGWMSEAARTVVGIDQFQHDPEARHWGFTSWNDFFTRRLREGARPVASPDDDSVIVSSCEATPYQISRDVQRRDAFWVKSQPYSLEDLLANDPAVDELVGGVVYQAFLSATNYHRWHAPVSGTIRRAWVQPGTYFSEADSEGADAANPPDSQGYLAHVAARAIILIDADDEHIGLVAVVPVGMIDVSSCVIGDGIAEGAHVSKGDELGYFQFGGSTECIIFQPGAIAEFAVDAIPQSAGRQPQVVPVRSALARAHRD
ncbi:phosphatidylserine decarboxylase family protein [Curtobacterium ammoniigenes]|uniref:phosphatidylserine decarboxylase family protein n=1 Tax=Curtobacterium ammoniigenes TaxID=395387 RepID=UPI000830F759|nr:phosphatidylserine decarboxylase family protein [Curtobacterium ammoniigenes]